MGIRYDDPFLNTGDNAISEMGRFARQYVHSDPTSCIVKQGMMVEYMVTRFLKDIGEQDAVGWDIGISEKLRILRDKGYWNEDLFMMADIIRKNRNTAVHRFRCDESTCRKMMRPLEEFCSWYGRYNSNFDVMFAREGQSPSKKTILRDSLFGFTLSSEAKKVLAELENLSN